MNHQLRSADLHPAGLGAALCNLGDCADLCVKVLGGDGKIAAVNERGLEILGIDATDFCGRVWSSFWQGESASEIEAAVARGLRGTSTEMVLEFGETGGTWDIRVMPLYENDGTIRRVLGVSRKLATSPHNPADLDVDAMAEMDRLENRFQSALHSLGNLVACTEACSRLARRRTDDGDVLQVLDEMARASEAAARMLTTLRDAPERTGKAAL